MTLATEAKHSSLNELEQSNEILRKENESLKEERDELQGKLSPFLAPNENQEEIVTDFKIENFNIDKNIGAVSHEIIRNDLSLEEQNNGDNEKNIKINSFVRLNSQLE